MQVHRSPPPDRLRRGPSLSGVAKKKERRLLSGPLGDDPLSFRVQYLMPNKSSDSKV